MEKILNLCYYSNPYVYVKERLGEICFLISQYNPQPTAYLSLLYTINKWLPEEHQPTLSLATVENEAITLVRFKRGKPASSQTACTNHITLSPRIEKVAKEIHEKLVAHTYACVHKHLLFDLMPPKLSANKPLYNDFVEDPYFSSCPRSLSQLIVQIEKSARAHNISLFPYDRDLRYQYQALQALRKSVAHWSIADIKAWVKHPKSVMPLPPKNARPKKPNWYIRKRRKEALKQEIRNFTEEDDSLLLKLCNNTLLGEVVWRVNSSFLRPFAKWTPEAPNIADTSGNTALHYAIQYEKYAVVCYLMTLPAIDLNKSNKVGVTPLALACRQDKIKLVKLLLAHPQTEPMQATIKGDDLLTWACKKDDIRLIKLLLARNININKLNRHHSTLLDSTFSNSVTSLLIQHGAQKTKDIAKNTYIAVALRAMEIIAGFSARIVQQLSLLCLLSPQKQKGRLLQINTGEGKSWVIALFAAIKALQKHQVDIVTTSHELSRREVQEKAPFFHLLNLTVAENSDYLPQKAPTSIKKNLLNFCRKPKKQKSTVKKEDQQQKIDKKKEQAYQANILYGIPFDFEADILNAEFYGKITLLSRRKRDILVVDEVDSMFIDDKGHSTRIASPTPAFNHLQNKLATIWRQLNDLDKQIITYQSQLTYFTVPLKKDKKTGKVILPSDIDVQKCTIPVQDQRKFIQKTLEGRMKVLYRKLTEEETLAKEAYDQLQNQLQQANQPAERTYILTQLKNSTWVAQKYPTADPPPKHLHDFLLDAYPRWIESALTAKYDYQKKEHYIIEDGKIIPIDHLNTGTLQRNVVWENGLTQFLCIKENLVVEPIQLNTNYLANVAFFKRYSTNIYGLTGTLGSRYMQNFLEDTYGLDTLIIPPYKFCTIRNNQDSAFLCKEFPPFVTDNIEEYTKAVACSCAQTVQQGRAVLLLVPYIRYAEMFKDCLKKYLPQPNIKTYTGEGKFGKHDHYLKAGDIIIATNIAGRGTDLKASKAINKKGGLHVIITFLPRNERIDRQNMGRTARKGQRGSGQFILYSGQKAWQLFQERDRLQQKNNEKAYKQVDQIHFENWLFQSFCTLLSQHCPNVKEYQKRLLQEMFEIGYKAACEKMEKIVKNEAQRLQKTLKEVYKHNNNPYKEGALMITQEALDSLQLKVGPNLYRKLKNGLVTPSVIEEVTNAYTENSLLTRAAYIKQVKDKMSKEKQNEAYDPDILAAAIADFKAKKKYKKPNFSPYIREGVIERWGLFLYSIRPHLAKGQVGKSYVKNAFQIFQTQIIADAHADKLVKNPYYYVLAGNETRDLLTSISSNEEQDLFFDTYYNRAYRYYECAIALDTTISLYAYYNKVYLMLKKYKKVTPEDVPGEEIRQTLQEAKKMLLLYYKPQLITFHLMVTAHGKKKTISAQIQHSINLLILLEENIQSALTEVKKKDSPQGSKKYHKYIFLASWEEIETILAKEKIAHEARTITLAQHHGLTHFFTLHSEYVGVLTWQEKAAIFGVTLLGISEVVLASYITIQFPGSGLLCTSILRKEGINDIWTALQASYKGEFDGRNWLVQKSVGIATDLIFAGLSTYWRPPPKINALMPTGAQEMRKITCENISSAFTSWDRVGKVEALFKQMMGVTIKKAGLEIAKGIAKQGLTSIIDYNLRKLVLPFIQEMISWVIEKEIMKFLQSKPLLQQALDLDQQHINQKWEQVILTTFEAVFFNRPIPTLAKAPSQSLWEKATQKGKEVFWFTLPHIMQLLERFLLDKDAMQWVYRRTNIKCDEANVHSAKWNRKIKFTKIAYGVTTLLYKLFSTFYPAFEAAYANIINTEMQMLEEKARIRKSRRCLPRQQLYKEDSDEMEEKDDRKYDNPLYSSDDKGPVLWTKSVKRKHKKDSFEIIAQKITQILVKQFTGRYWDIFLRPEVSKVANFSIEALTDDVTKRIDEEAKAYHLKYLNQARIEVLTHDKNKPTALENQDKALIRAQAEKILKAKKEEAQKTKKVKGDAQEEESDKIPSLDEIIKQMPSEIYAQYVKNTKDGGEGNYSVNGMLVEKEKRPCYIYDKDHNLLQVIGKQYDGAPIELVEVRGGKMPIFELLGGNKGYEISSDKNNLYEIWALALAPEGSTGVDLEKRGQKLREDIVNELTQNESFFLAHSLTLQLYMPTPPPPPSPPPVVVTYQPVVEKETNALLSGFARFCMCLGRGWERFSQEMPYVAKALPTIITVAGTVATSGTSTLFTITISTAVSMTTTAVVEYCVADEHFSKNYPTVCRVLPYLSTFTTSFVQNGMVGILKTGASIAVSRGVAWSCDKVMAKIDTEKWQQKVSSFFQEHTDLSEEELDFISNKIVKGAEGLTRATLHYYAGKATGKLLDKGIEKYKQKQAQKASSTAAKSPQKVPTQDAKPESTCDKGGPKMPTAKKNFSGKSKYTTYDSSKGKVKSQVKNCKVEKSPARRKYTVYAKKAKNEGKDKYIARTKKPREKAKGYQRKKTFKGKDVLPKQHPKVHGNSKLCKRKQHLYVIKDKNGNIMEYGISGGKLNKDGTSRRAKQKLRTKKDYKDNPGEYTAHVIKTDIDGRAKALALEKEYVTKYDHDTGAPPDNQKRPKPDSKPKTK